VRIVYASFMAVIVHAATFAVGTKGGGFQHNTAIKLSNGLIRNGHLVLNFSDRDVARAASVMGHSKFGRAAVNRALLGYCRANRPDLLLLGHADLIEPATVAEIRNAVPGLRVMQWNVDPLFEPENVARIEAKLGMVDATLVSTGPTALGGLRVGGRHVGFLPNPVDLSIERGENHLKAVLPFDLFYACGHPGRPLRRICGKDWHMDEFMTALLAELPGVKPLLAGLHGRPRLGGANYQAALESAALGLNISRRADWPLYSSDRLAQMIGNGMAVLIERATGYDKLFDDDEMLFFSTFDELVAKIRDMVAAPAARQALAAKGRDKYVRLFNERTVAQYLMDFAFDRAHAATYGWPAELF
jgi:Glycosyl transferases group 1